MKILVVEDEILIQKSLTKMLERGGHQVDATALGKEAIKLIQKNNYDRIVCDLMLQDTTGFEVIEESKKVFNHDQISDIFIIMTAYGSAQVLDTAFKYGCTILGKPFEDINEALSIITKMKD